MLYYSKSEKETAQLAAAFATFVQPRDIVALWGDLGVGKTAFCRFFIQALTHNKDEVPSPTFTLLQTYQAPDFPIDHFDLYRLDKPEDVYELGIEDAFAEGVTLIEWPDKMGKLLPSTRRLNINIAMQKDERTFTFTTSDHNLNKRLEKWIEKNKSLFS